MALDPDLIAQLRRMIDERTTEVYSDALLTAIIEAAAVTDPRGEEPGVWDTTTTPPTWEVNPLWVATYDLNAAAAAVWEEKAAALSGEYDLTSEGIVYHNSQKYEQALGMARYHRARRVAGNVGT